MNNVKNVVLLACGSFNPPTVMHLRLFEIARDSLTRHGYNVLGGVISPVHDGYGKKGLVRSSERCAMVKLALQSSDWVRLSDWESTQEEWSETKKVLYHHQRREEHAWLTENIVNSEGPVKVMLLCGGDMLDSFGTPGLWKACDIETIVGDYGLVVISRSDSNPQKTIYESDVLTKFQKKY
ncbi:hypothetical protein B566_EDAN009383 [Ephemera danica]|nr:hypothetical protein B566_EDAN009383 [Ephemera danica]